MPDSQPRAHIANYYLHASIRGAERQGFQRETLLASAGVPAAWLENPEQLITEEQLTQLIKTVWRATRDEFMGLSTRRCKNGTFALMTDYCLGSATLGAVLRKSARFFNIACDNIDISLNELAQLLHMTPRSIGRKLQEEGTSLRKIKTSLRQEYAIKLMMTENLSVADVSERVGFSETASFCRAFKRWTGKPPSQWPG